jgi:hypothetical protein
VSFDALRNAVRRMIAAGRIRDDGELVIAGRMWSLSHGAVMLEMAGFFGHEEHGLTEILGPLTIDALVGMGDDRDKATQSMHTAAGVLTADSWRANSDVSTSMSVFRQLCRCPRVSVEACMKISTAVTGPSNPRTPGSTVGSSPPC